MKSIELRPGEWVMHEGKPSITWWYYGDKRKGEPELLTCVRTYPDESARLHAVASSPMIFAADGSVNGVFFRDAREANPRRAAVIAIQLGVHGKPRFVSTMLGLDGKDFHEVYARAVTIVADHFQIPADSPLRSTMKATSQVFLRKHGLALKEVRYEAVVRVDQSATPTTATGPAA